MSYINVSVLVNLYFSFAYILFITEVIEKASPLRNALDEHLTPKPIHITLQNVPSCLDLVRSNHTIFAWRDSMLIFR